MANECVVYHKHLAGMDLTEGYIGVSKNFEERMKQHHREAFVRNSIYTVHENMRIYGEDIITLKIFEGTENECYEYENELRPRWRMGWNMAIGGGQAGSGWKPGPLWLDNRLWHADHGERVISINYKPPDLAKEFDIDASNIRRVLQGRTVHSNGWEFADAQLVQKIKERFDNKWEHAYITNGTKTVSVYRTGNLEFRKSNNTAADTVYSIYTGSQPTRNGWEMATKEEWLATAERVEYK